MTPSSAATTNTTMSVTFPPRALMRLNAPWPGVSMNPTLRLFTCTLYAPMCCVVPPPSPAATPPLPLAPLLSGAGSDAACARLQSLACPPPDAAAAAGSAYSAACLDQPSEALYPAARAATSRDALGCAALDARPQALRRAAAQMVSVGPQVRHSAHLIHLTVKDRIVHLAPTISDASVDPDLARLAVDLPSHRSEVVRGSRQSASAGAPRPRTPRRPPAPPPPAPPLGSTWPPLPHPPPSFPPPPPSPPPPPQPHIAH